MDDKLKKLDCAVSSLAVFRSLLSDEVIKGFRSFCGSMPSDDMAEKIYSYSGFVSGLYKETDDLSEYIMGKVLADENFYITGKARGQVFDSVIEECVENELKILQQLSRLTSGEVKWLIGYDGFLPSWKNTDIDFAAEYRERLRNIGRFGYGQYAVRTMFSFGKDGIVPVENPDKQRLSELYGYERERKSVVDNTLALLEGRPAQNVLLYGDAGTGKSSTVKAIVNEYADRGLRLIELTKEQLRDIPRIIGEISRNPLKFIIFIDDLSFSSAEDGFGALKAALEGSASARADNSVIYATSNRRHLVRESFSDREGDDVHRNDTMQEILSLSARFGLRVNFGKPDKKSYVEIASELAKQHGISISGDELALRAEQFAMQGNGRSPRTAKQFVYQLLSEEKYMNGGS